MKIRAGIHSDSQNTQEPPSPATSRRLPRIRILQSIRFRLTAWYTIVLVVILALLGVLLSTFMSRALEDEVDARLLEASDQAVQENQELLEGTDWSVDVELTVSRELETLLDSGLFVIVNNFQLDRLLEEGSAPQELTDVETGTDEDAFAVLVGDDESVRLTLRPLSDESDRLIGAMVVTESQDDDEGVELSTIVGDESTFTTFNLDGHRVRLYARPFFSDGLAPGENEGQPAGAIVVGESLERQEHILELFNKLLRTAGAGGVLLATWGGWLLAGRALAPVDRITSTVNRIARQGDAQESLSTRLDVNDTGDELARLSITFNAMLERIERAFRTQRRFVADASHELRTPLTAIRGNVDVLQRGVRNGHALKPEMLQESLGEMKRESDRMARLIEDLLMLARTDAEGLGHMVNREPTSLDGVAREAFRTAEALASGQRLHLTIRQPLLIYGDGDRLVQVMIILLDNAMRHTPPGGTVDLIIDAAETDDGKRTCARIQVIDSGEGIPAEHLPHLFERFYRIEGSRSRLAGGSGLGLAIALAIVRGHNGWIDVESEEGQGTHVTVWLPVLDSPVGEKEGPPVLPHLQESPQA